MTFTNRFILKMLLLVIILVMYVGCSKTKLYLEAAESPTSHEVADQPNIAPTQVHYFYDRTESMKGFAYNSESAYLNTIRLIRTTGELFWSPIETDHTYYVYGDTQIGRIDGALVENREEGLSAADFYGLNPPASFGNVLGIRVRYRGEEQLYGSGQPLLSVNTYVNEMINSHSDTLYVVVADFFKRDNKVQMPNFFRQAFERGLSGAFFAVESEFNGIMYDIIGNDTPFPEEGTTGDIRSTFFILITGNRSHVTEYSKELFTKLNEKEIKFNSSVFLTGSKERIFPVPEGLSVVNLERVLQDNEKIRLLQWDGDVSVLADVETYNINILGKFGTQYSASISDSIIYDDGNFLFPVTPQVWHSSGEDGRVKSGTISQFEDITANNPFIFQTKIQPSETNNQFYKSLFFDGKTNAFNTFAPGFYKISYRIETQAKVPDWVSEKDATEVQEFVDSLDDEVVGELIKVLNFQEIYKGIVEAYNRVEFRPAWSGEFYLIATNWLYLIIAIIIFFLVIATIILYKNLHKKRLIREVFDIEIRMKKLDDSMPILIGRCTIDTEKVNLVKTKFTLQDLCEKAIQIGKDTKQAGFEAKTIDDNINEKERKSNRELLQRSGSNKFRFYSFEGKKGAFIIKLDEKKRDSEKKDSISIAIKKWVSQRLKRDNKEIANFIENEEISFVVNDSSEKINYEFRLIKAAEKGKEYE